jgi:hypothetical protein
VAALLAHLLLPPLVPALLWWTATLVLAFLNILCALTLVALFTSWPVPVRNANPARVSRRHAVLTLCLVAWSLLLLASAFPSDPAAFLGDARAAGLSLALLYLVQGWLSQPEKSPLLDELAELRRGILLDGLDPAAAARQLRLLVQGADIEEMARPHVLACLRAIATAEGEVRRCTEELKAFCDLLGREVCPLRAPEQSMGVTVFESQKRRLAAAAEARRAAVLAYGEMKVRLARLGKLRPAESRVVEQMDAYIIERDSGIDALEGQRQALAQDVARTLAARALPSSPQPAAKS